MSSADKGPGGIWYSTKTVHDKFNYITPRSMNYFVKLRARLVVLVLVQTAPERVQVTTSLALPFPLSCVRSRESSRERLRLRRWDAILLGERAMAPHTVPSSRSLSHTCTIRSHCTHTETNNASAVYKQTGLSKARVLARRHGEGLAARCVRHLPCVTDNVITVH